MTTKLNDSEFERKINPVRDWWSSPAFLLYILLCSNSLPKYPFKLPNSKSKIPAPFPTWRVSQWLMIGIIHSLPLTLPERVDLAWGRIFTTFGPPCLDVDLDCGEKFTVVYHSSTSTHIPIFIKRRKNCRRTEIEFGFMRTSPSGDDLKRNSKCGSTWFECELISHSKKNI